MRPFAISGEISFSKFCKFMKEEFGHVFSRVSNYGDSRYYRFDKANSKSIMFLIVIRKSYTQGEDVAAIKFRGADLGPEYSFQEFFENLDDDKKEDFLFHLDIFSKM